MEELGATTRRADVEGLKAFVTRDYVKKRPAFGKQLVRKPALCSFLGTVNHDGAGFLNDMTGTTRFLACEIAEIDFHYTITDVDQLWAEAYWYYRNVPRSWELTEEQERIRARLNASYEVPSALEELAIELFEMTGDQGDWIATQEIKAAVGLHYRITSEQIFLRELTRVLTKLGCERARATYKVGSGHRRGWRGLKRRDNTNVE